MYDGVGQLFAASIMSIWLHIIERVIPGTDRVVVAKLSARFGTNNLDERTFDLLKLRSMKVHNHTEDVAFVKRGKRVRV
ncbi:hypothetical protein PI124_g20098 [Phytophthora idaei]|nr:hypothetical protein PI125_g21179 [Phytophthora idaei]KAG3132809.1 hypothetical protein PI126_g19467 [Phytophthora idaei]KAG3234847.1 hypothetical protein PI124_g20098 [Phytophthora idaei]